MVMDNEAGLEHLSRRTTQNVDVLLIISDHSMKGVRTIGRIRELVTELKLVVKQQSVVINLVRDGLDSAITEELTRLNVDNTAIIPWDDEVYQYDLKLKPLLDLPDTSKAVTAIDGLMAKILN